MTCEDTRTKLTAYLDGDLEDERGSAVRGHLRGCEPCRQVASDEAALRDGLRALTPVDPPASLWAGVQARLAAAEVADAKRPAWRRALSRPLAWLRPQSLSLSLAGAAIATVVVLVVWKSRHDDTPGQVASTPPPVHDQNVVIQPSMPPPPPIVDHADVTADLAAAPARETASYADSAAELKKLADEARVGWSDDRKHAFDTRVATLQAAIDHAAEGRDRQHAYRALIRYLQGAAVRDEVAIR
jgi:hypothetical protein